MRDCSKHGSIEFDRGRGLVRCIPKGRGAVPAGEKPALVSCCHRRSGSRSHKKRGSALCGPSMGVHQWPPKRRTTWPNLARALGKKHPDPRMTATWQCQTRVGPPPWPWQFRPQRNSTHSSSGFCPDVRHSAKWEPCAVLAARNSAAEPHVRAQNNIRR